jgi:hypothetical protein
MSEETLLTAARRVVRFMNIDQAKGGFTTDPTFEALHTLRRQLAMAEKNPSFDRRLFDAARAFEVRFSIDESNSGGLTSVETLKAVEALDKQVRRLAALESSEVAS